MVPDGVVTVVISRHDRGPTRRGEPDRHARYLANGGSSMPGTRDAPAQTSLDGLHGAEDVKQAVPGEVRISANVRG